MLLSKARPSSSPYILNNDESRSEVACAHWFYCNTNYRNVGSNEPNMGDAGWISQFRTAQNNTNAKKRAAEN